jgi:ParB-like chromosome segregation protein Spo0J
VPILAREDGTVIAGHGRLLAGQAEGATEVPVIVARGWTEEQCRAYAIADNMLGHLRRPRAEPSRCSALDALSPRWASYSSLSHSVLTP